MTRKMYAAALVPLSIVFLWSCASQSGAVSQGTAPEWVVLKPSDTNSEYYFVASGSGATGDVVGAEEAAAANLLSQINQYLGTSVEVLTVAETRTSVEDFEQSIVDTVTLGASGTISGLRIVDRFDRSGNGTVEVYFLASYDRSELEKERALREELFQRLQDVVAVPEREGEAALSQGNYYGAMQKFIQAARGALNDGVRNPELKFNSNMQRALELARGFTIAADSHPSRIESGMGSEIPFVASLSYLGEPISDAEFTVSYSELGNNNRSRLQRQALQSDGEGKLIFNLPPVRQSGEQQITMVMDNTELRGMVALDQEGEGLLSALNSSLGRVRVQFDVQYLSAERSIPLLIYGVEVNLDGSVRVSTRGRNAVVQQLLSAGFRVSPLQVSEGQVLSESEALAEAEGFADQYPRLIYIDLMADSFQEDRDGVFVSASGEIRIIDLSNGELLFRDDGIKTEFASTLIQGNERALEALGEVLGGQVLSGF